MPLLGTKEKEYLDKGGTLTNGSIPNKYDDSPILSTSFPKLPEGNKITPVVTSKVADDHVNDLGSIISKANIDIQNATASLKQSQMAKAEADKAQKQQDIENQQNAPPEDATTKLLTALTGAKESQTSQEQQIIDEDKEQNKVDEANLSTVSDAIDSMNAGTYPLTATEKASVDNLSSQFTGLFQSAQELTKNQLGGQTVVNATNKFQMYSPEEAISRIAGIIKSGNAKVAEINGKLIDAQAKLTESFQDQDFKTATSLYNKISDTLKERRQEISDMNKALADERKLIQDKIDKQADELNKNKNEILMSLGKSLVPVPPAVISAVNNAKSMGEAVTAAGKYLQDTPTSGIVGEYLFYKRQAEEMGQVPVDFNEYQNIDANRKARAASSANGVAPAVLSKIETIANKMGSEQVVKDYNTAATQINYIAGLGDKPTDDMARVYAFAKVMDPNSVVRESEYKTVQDYAQAVLQAAGLKAKRVFTNSGFLTPEAREYIESTLNSRLTTQEKTYSNIFSEYARRINKLTGGSDGEDYLTDYSKGYENTGNTLLKNGQAAKKAVDDFVVSNPQYGEVIGKLYDVPGTTDADVVEWLKLNHSNLVK